MSSRRGDEHGSALLLMPAGVLIVLLLGALAVDSAIMFLGERELADLTAAAANDAATTALDRATFYGCGALRISPEEARSVATTTAGTRTTDAVRVTAIDITVHNDRSPPQIAVSASGTVRLVFTPTVAGRSLRRHVVQARSVAVPQHLEVADVTPRC